MLFKKNHACPLNSPLGKLSWVVKFIMNTTWFKFLACSLFIVVNGQTNDQVDKVTLHSDPKSILLMLNAIQNVTFSTSSNITENRTLTFELDSAQGMIIKKIADQQLEFGGSAAVLIETLKKALEN